MHQAEHVDFARHPGLVAQAGLNEHAPLDVDFGALAEVVDQVEELDAGRVGAGHGGEPGFDGLPDGHRVEADGLAASGSSRRARPCVLSI